MRFATSLAAIAAFAATARAEYDSYDVVVEVEGPFLEPVDTPIAEIHRSTFEDFGRLVNQEDDDPDVVYDDDQVTWTDGSEFYIELLEGFTLANSESIRWYSCTPETTDDYECEIYSYGLDAAGTTSLGRRTTTLASTYFDLGGEDPYTDAPADASVTIDTDMTTNDAEAVAIVSYDGLVKTSSYFDVSVANTVSYLNVMSLEDENDTSRAILYSELTFVPSSPCYVLEDAVEDEFHTIFGIIYEDASSTVSTEWQDMAADIFDETHHVCSGAATLLVSSAAAVAAILAF